MRAKIRASITVLLLLLAAGRAGAQFQYTPPGGPEEKPASRREAIETEVAQARYHLGVVRIAPWLVLRDVAYVRSLFASGVQSAPSDFTATVGAGFRAYLRNTPKVTWSLGVLPEYVWWQREAERRRVNGHYKLGVQGYFNRLTVEAKAGREQQLQIVTPEVPVLASSRADGAEVLVEVEVTHSIYAFTSVAETQETNLVEAEVDPLTRSLALLDRKDRLLRGGLRWQPHREWWVALGVEGSRADFDHTALPLSNSGTAPLLQIHFRNRYAGFDGEIDDRSLNAQRGADFVPFHKVTGNAGFLLGTQRRGGSIYSSRNLVYALATGYAYIQDDRLGAALLMDFGFHTSGRLFAETGKNEYTAFSPDIPHRVDDVTSGGGQLNFNLGGQLVAGVQILRSRFNSNVPGGDRTFTSAGL
ncbi:MAG TPA: hypothetical protein VGQ28_17805, partial [Thermoanaerobaculia bacterium]|nr:hypothetical protein [Thermoanaerobaculia bacterium]